MLTAYIHFLTTDDAGAEEPGVSRDRLKDRFPKGATRRMTQLGMLVSAALEPHKPAQNDTLIYASEYAESRALEGYLDSFPSASPTLFQTSIHPSAVQQGMIQRLQPIGAFFPMTGRKQLVAHALQTALLAETPRVILCGGEERGTWLLENGVASDRAFAFALTLTREPTGAMGKISLAPSSAPDGELTLPRFFDALQRRESLDLAPAAGVRLILTWS